MVLGSGGTKATLTIDLPGPGRLVAASKKGGKKPVLQRLVVKARAKATVKAGLRLTAAGKASLRSGGRLSVPVTFTFTPDGGTACSQTRSVVFKALAGPRSR